MHFVVAIILGIVCGSYEAKADITRFKNLKLVAAGLQNGSGENISLACFAQDSCEWLSFVYWKTGEQGATPFGDPMPAQENIHRSLIKQTRDFYGWVNANRSHKKLTYFNAALVSSAAAGAAVETFTRPSEGYSGTRLLESAAIALVFPVTHSLVHELKSRISVFGGENENPQSNRVSSEKFELFKRYLESKFGDAPSAAPWSK